MRWGRRSITCSRAGKARDLAQRRLYAAQMNQAFRAWDVGNLDVARALLDAQHPSPGAPDLRGADWRWLWALCQSEAKAVLPTQGEWQLFAAEPSPDGRRVATAGWSKDIVIYDLESGAKLQTLAGHTRMLASGRPLAFSPDGQRLASASGGLLQSGGKFELHLRDLVSGKTRKLRYTPVERCPGSPVFSPNGRLLAFSTGNNIRIWDLEAEQEKTVLRGSTGSIVNLRFLPDGQHLVSACEFGRPLLWDIERPEKLPTLRGFREGVRSMTVSADNRWLVVGSGDFFDPQRPAEVLVFDLASQQPLLPPLEHPKSVDSLSLTPDGKLLATGCADGSVRVFTLPGGELRRTLTNAVTNKRGNLVFTPDGRTLVTSSALPRQFTVWNTATWEATPLIFQIKNAALSRGTATGLEERHRFSKPRMRRSDETPQQSPRAPR